MTIATGDRLPDATFLEKVDGKVGPVAGPGLLAGRRVVLFGLPGAYTGTCSTMHLPSFIRVADALRAKGIAEIACVAVNDPHVMAAWGESSGATAAGIRMLSDAASDFTTALGVAYDNPAAGMFHRSRRYALLAEDGVVKVFNLEENNGQCAVSSGETMLDAWFPAPSLSEDSTKPAGLDSLHGDDDVRRVSREVIEVHAELDEAPRDTADCWLRLHLLSHRLVKPHEVNLTGVFGLLTNVVWTNHGPCAVDGFEETRMRLRATGAQVTVYGVDKFPRMVDYVVPSGVRIADADRVRLGAHLAEGTTVMQEGFCNFNAGTLGTSMVEGRISAGVIVGADSDIGGGSSIMGMLSGGGKQVISIGERCLLGANAGLGISLGDDCTVEAGLYLTAGTRVTAPDGQVVKAATLSGRDGLLFRRNSVSGAVEVLATTVDWGSLNADLHANG